MPQASFPSWKAQDLNRVIVHDLARDQIAAVDPLALDLLQQCLYYTPAQRISAKAALSHPYFSDLDRSGFGAEM